MFAVGIAATAHAQYSSPELMFVYDTGDGTTAHTPKIDRYDPISRQYLGSFGTNFLPAGQVGAMTVMGHDLYFLTNNNSGSRSRHRFQFQHRHGGLLSRYFGSGLY